MYKSPFRLFAHAMIFTWIMTAFVVGLSHLADKYLPPMSGLASTFLSMVGGTVVIVIIILVTYAYVRWYED
jgi:hypothetical protein